MTKEQWQYRSKSKESLTNDAGTLDMPKKKKKKRKKKKKEEKEFRHRP